MFLIEGSKKINPLDEAMRQSIPSFIIIFIAIFEYLSTYFDCWILSTLFNIGIDSRWAPSAKGINFILLKYFLWNWLKCLHGTFLQDEWLKKV